ncbi:MAG: glycosyltransferase [Patescibacteria group bacterium]
MKISIVINVLCSYEVVRRQLLHFKKMDLPEGVEIIIIDDGSNPPIPTPNVWDVPINLMFWRTEDKRPWTQGLARNAGAKLAKGEYLMMTDIDHIFSKEAIMATYEYVGDKMVFPRHYGALNENGDLVTDLEGLLPYGLNVDRLKGRRGWSAGFHGNTFAIKRSIFMELGGYEEKRCVGMMHQGKRRGEDIYFSLAYNNAMCQGKYKPIDTGPKMYMFPIGRFHVNGDTNPGGLFHNLSYDLTPQPMMP